MLPHLAENHALPMARGSGLARIPARRRCALKKLLTIGGLSDAIGIPSRTLRSLYIARKIPFIKTGHRSLFFDPVKVLAALDKFEVRPVV